MKQQTQRTRLNEEQIKLVHKVLIKQLDVAEEQITPDACIVNDLGADSLDVVSIMMGLEEEFGITLSDEDSENIKTVGDAYGFIAQTLEKAEKKLP